jgi:RNA polymerase sigma factor (TIGR02999 family)
VHEAYLQLVDQTRANLKDRQHFFAVAATAMRRILIDHARTRGRLRRGGGRERTELDEIIDGCAQMNVDLLALDEALGRLAHIDPAKARLVELRFFAGMSLDEAAEALGASPRTLKREWTVAKGWLYRELRTGTVSDERALEKD